MQNIGVIFGGKSVENDISVLTAIEAMSHVNVSKYNIFPIYIGKDGEWLYSKLLSELKSFEGDALSSLGAKQCFLMPNDRTLYCAAKFKRLKSIAKLDAALICGHGSFVEDGCLQGLLECAGIPYTGAGVLQSAVCMNKYFFKCVADSLGYNTLKYLHIRKNANAVFDEIEFPVIVKPCSLGSSIGVSVARSEASLELAAQSALTYDDEILIERKLEDFIEINCAVMTKKGKTLVSECEQPINSSDYLSFSDKYISGDKFSGQANAERIFPAKIDQKLAANIKTIAKELYEKLGLAGVIRVDFLVKDGEVFVNEINSIPGALSNYLFDMSYGELISCLLDEAIARSNAKCGLKRAFASGVLTNLTQKDLKNTCNKLQ